MCVDQQTLVILFFRQTKHFVTHKFQTFTGHFRNPNTLLDSEPEGINSPGKISNVLDVVAPRKTKTISCRPKTPWRCTTSVTTLKF